MIEQIREQLKRIKNLSQLTWYQGYIAACKDNGIISKKECLKLKEAISKRQCELLFGEYE